MVVTIFAKMFVLVVLFAHSTEAMIGKSTYAMSHPFAYKAWMEKFLAVEEVIVRANSTKTCVEWVKLCIKDGPSPDCDAMGTGTSPQIHSVGAYLRDSGDMSMQAIELQFTQALAGMKEYDPMMELHAGFHTTDLDSYINKFKAADIPFLATKFESAGKKYDSIIVQVDGSLAPGAKSLLVLELIGQSSISSEAVFFSTPRASEASLRRALAQHTSSDALTLLHTSFPSSNITRDIDYFENVLNGEKVEMSNTNGTIVYSGTLFAGDLTEVRYVQSNQPTHGATTVAQWEDYRRQLHAKCIPSPNPDNEGFDRLADLHIGAHNANGGGSNGPGTILDTYIVNQKNTGLPYRVYSPPGGGGGHYFLYLYGPNGWGAQITGTCESSAICPGKHVEFYNMCTQGIKGHCRKDD